MNPLPILRDAWYFYRSHLLPIALLCLPLLALEALTRHGLSNWLWTTPSPAYDIIVGLMFSPLYGAALILYLGSRSAGAYPGTSELLGRALQLWPMYALLTGLSALLLMCGLALLVIPGVWLMVRISFAEFLLVLHGRPPLEALRESFRLTEGHFWPILLCMLCVMLPLWGVSAWAFHPDGGLDPEALGTLPLQVLIGFGQLFMTVALFRFFMLIKDPANKTEQPGQPD